MTPENRTQPEARIIPRAEHPISRRQIDENCLKVLYRLRRHGYKAYLVGGSVRDLLLERRPKDFDVATDATPNQVKKLFRNCFLVGRRFRLAHIRFGRDQLIEVATFRRQATADDLPEDPADQRFFAENIFGTPAEDASRRDLTINALYYDIDSFSIVDYVGGLEDLQQRRIRVIGDPLVRFTEDPVRMLRALEFSARLDFKLDPEARQAIYSRAPLIGEAAPARLREEIMELFRHKVGGKVLRHAQGVGLLRYLIPDYVPDETTFDLLDALDRRTAEGQPIPEHQVIAALYYAGFMEAIQGGEGLQIGDALHAAREQTTPHGNQFRIAAGIRHTAREMLIAAFRFQRGRGRRGERRFLQHPLTAEALDLYRLWLETSGGDPELAEVWREGLKNPDRPTPTAEGPKRRRRRRPRRSPRPSPTKP